MALSGCPRLSGASWLKLEPLPSPQPGEWSFLQSGISWDCGLPLPGGRWRWERRVHGQLAFPATDGWLASKLRLPACVRWMSWFHPCENRVTGGSTLCWNRVFFYWCKVPPNRPLCRMLQNHTVVQNQNLFSWCALPNNSSSAYPKLSEYQAIVRIQLINTKH